MRTGHTHPCPPHRQQKKRSKVDSRGQAAPRFHGKELTPTNMCKHVHTFAHACQKKNRNTRRHARREENPIVTLLNTVVEGPTDRTSELAPNPPTSGGFHTCLPSELCRVVSARSPRYRVILRTQMRADWDWCSTYRLTEHASPPISTLFTKPCTLFPKKNSWRRNASSIITTGTRKLGLVL